jgi:hypothetical protein
MNKNRLLRRQGWRSGQKTANSILIKARKRKAGERAVKVRWLIWGDLVVTRAEKSAARVVAMKGWKHSGAKAQTVRLPAAA